MKITTTLYSVLVFLILLLTIDSCKKTNTDPCAITGQSTQGVGNYTATLSWGGSTAPYAIQYRIVGTTTWTAATSTVNSFSLTNLLSHTNYEWQVKGFCSTGFTGSSTFTTTGCTSGYEGVNCATESRAKYLGTWTSNGTAESGGNTLSVNVTTTITSGTSIDKVIESFTYGGDTYTFPQAFSGDYTTFTIPPTLQPDGSTATGSGTYTSANAMTELLVLTYPASGSTPAQIVNVNLTSTK